MWTRGRTSTRVVEDPDVALQGGEVKSFLRWDHGCQFIRADVPQFRSVIEGWVERGWAREWKGKFYHAPGTEFFGMGGAGYGGPFYVGVGGFRQMITSILEDAATLGVTLHKGIRVAGVTPSNNKAWVLRGVSGEAAFHDTPETVAAAATSSIIGHAGGYDAVILTDLSSSFGGWHRASAGVPESFATLVKEKVGARVPLFTVMIAFEEQLPVLFDAATFGDDNDDDTLWFACRKPGILSPVDGLVSCRDCWVIVSTPEYAMRQIEEVPMQTNDGTFIPQPKNYLIDVASDLEKNFRRVVAAGALTNGQKLDPQTLPKTCYLNAQRWGSAMRAHPSLTPTPKPNNRTNAAFRKKIMGVVYDSRRDSLAPTLELALSGENVDTFVSDPDSMIFQAGDMVGAHTPGAESAALSGLDCGRHVRELLIGKKCV